jgi:hypothetical protein
MSHRADAATTEQVAQCNNCLKRGGVSNYLRFGSQGQEKQLDYRHGACIFVVVRIPHSCPCLRCSIQQNVSEALQIVLVDNTQTGNR